MEYKGQKYYAVLLGCACDLPAGRKLCGLLSFSARIGCSKCTKEFETGGFGEKTNYGRFDRWYPKRDYKKLKEQAEKARNAKTQTQQQAIEKAAGCRWSELMRLPYFDAVQMCMIDPLHCLFLGVSKFMLKDIFPEHCKFTDDIMHAIQEIVDSTQLPSDVGRIPYKISSNFSNFTADQHRNWTIYCSLHALKPYLPKEGYDVWKNFVEAAWIYTRPVITVTQVSQAHEKMMKFLKSFEIWLDSSKTTPNFHMSSHLAEQILDYGSFYSYWCFPFERYNGIQGNFHTNQRSVEIQLMRKFTRNTYLYNLTPPEDYKEELSGLLSFSRKEEGSLSVNAVQSIPIVTLQSLFSLADGSVPPLDVDNDIFFDETVYKVVGCGESSYVDSSCHKQFLHTAVETILGPISAEKVSGAFRKFAVVNYLGESYGSVDGTMSRNAHVMVNSWLGTDGAINCNTKKDRPAEICYFVKMYVEIENKRRALVFAYVHWFQRHSAECFYDSELAKVYAKSLFEIDGPASFVPIQKIKSKFISAFSKYKGEGIRIVIPKSPKIYW